MSVDSSYLSPFQHSHIRLNQQNQFECFQPTFNELVETTFHELFYANQTETSAKWLRKLAVGRATRDWQRLGFSGYTNTSVWFEPQLNPLTGETLPPLLQNDTVQLDLFGGGGLACTPSLTNRGGYSTEGNIAGDKQNILSLDWLSWTLNLSDMGDYLKSLDEKYINKSDDQDTEKMKLYYFTKHLEKKYLVPLRELLENYFGVASEPERGRFNIQYEYKQQFAGVVNLYWSTKPEPTTNRYNFHIALPGQALALLGEKHGFKSIDRIFLLVMETFTVCNALSFSISRCDWAIDDFTGNMTTDKVIQCMDDNAIVTKFHRLPNPSTGKGGWHWIPSYAGNDHVGYGRTAYFGHGDKVVRFYNKAVEQNELDQIWHRAELQLRGECARSMVNHLIGKSYDQICDAVTGYFAASLDFKVPDPNDSNKSRWETCDWWQKFCGGLFFKFQLPKFEPRIERTFSWMEAVSGCFALAYDVGARLNPENSHEAGYSTFLSFLEMGREKVARSKVRQKLNQAMVDNYLLVHENRKPVTFDHEITLKSGQKVFLQGLYEQPKNELRKHEFFQPTEALCITCKQETTDWIWFDSLTTLCKCRACAISEGELSPTERAWTYIRQGVGVLEAVNMAY